jgi:hypothetical protein
MIAVDMSTWITFLSAQDGEDAELLDGLARPAGVDGTRGAHRTAK